MDYGQEATTTERWLILSDKDTQKFPQGSLVVVSAEDRKDKKGGTMPVMTLKDENGGKYVICAWKRDVQECILQYGSNTDQWDDVRFEVKNGRMQLVPSRMVIIEERV